MTLLSNQNLKAVCMFDPAIAVHVPAETMLEYVKTRKFDLVEPYIKKAEPPTIYGYRRLSRSIMDRYVDSVSSDEAKAVAAFQYGVTYAKHMRTNDGARIDWEPSGSTGTPDGPVKTLTDQETDLFSRAEQVEIGTVIYNASFLPPWYERGYLVPHTSVSLWARLEHPSAAASPSTVAQSNETPLPVDSPPTAQTGPDRGRSENASGQATAATAAGSNG